MRIFARVSSGVAVAAALLLWSAGTFAQTAVPQGVANFVGQSVGAIGVEGVGPTGPSVFQRARPDYDPLGIHMGSFYAYPAISVGGTYNSNIYATPTGVVGDWYTDIQPSLSVNSDWNRHAVALNALLEQRIYATQSSENQTNFGVQGAGRYDIATDEYIASDAGYLLNHEDRSSQNANFGINPTEYHVTNFDLSYVRRPTALGYRVDTTLTSYSYNNQATASGPVIDQQQRDRIEFVAAPTVTYLYAEPYEVFARFVGNIRHYDHKYDQNGFQRSSYGLEGDAGFGYKITSLIDAELYVGYLTQEYDDSRLSSNSGVAFGGNLLWNITPLTSIRMNASRSVAESTIVGFNSNVSGAVESQVQLIVEHELLRNVLVNLRVGYVNDIYNGTPGQIDNSYEAEGGVRYLINRNFSASANVDYIKRSSNVVSANYDRAQITVGLKAGF